LVKWKPLEQLQEGDVIAENILGSNSQDLIVHTGQLVSKALIQKLHSRGISWISVFEDVRKAVQIHSAPFSQEKLDEMEEEISQVFEKILKEERVEVARVETLGREISHAIISTYGEYLVPSLSKLRELDDYTFNHQVNVSIIATSIAAEMFPHDIGMVERIATGGLLHDMGKLWIPLEILNSKKRLADMEFDIIKKHPKYGHGIALMSGIEDQVVLDCILFHHERVDGTGYCTGLKGEEIPFAGRLMMVADVFDALTSVRPYKKGWSPYDAVSFIIKETGKMFDQKIVNPFIKAFGIYPVGTEVLLSDGLKGTVVGNRKGTISRPLISFERNGESKLVDLFERKDLRVVEVLRGALATG